MEPLIERSPVISTYQQTEQEVNKNPSLSSEHHQEPTEQHRAESSAHDVIVSHDVIPQQNESKRSESSSHDCTTKQQQQQLHDSQRRLVDRRTGYLLSNVSTLMDPVSYIRDPGREGTGPWWEHRSAQPSQSRPASDAVQQGETSMISTSRTDYRYRGSSVTGNTRFSSKPEYARLAAVGGAPINVEADASLQRDMFWREKISYEHKYNSRRDPNYPIPGKREGCIVLEKKSIPQSVTAHSIDLKTS